MRNMKPKGIIKPKKLKNRIDEKVNDWDENLIAQIEEKVPYVELEGEKNSKILEDDKGSDYPDL